MNLSLNPTASFNVSRDADVPLQWHAGDELRRVAIDCEILLPSYPERVPLKSVWESVMGRLTSRDANDAVWRSDRLRFFEAFRLLASDHRWHPEDRETLQVGMEELRRQNLWRLPNHAWSEVRALHPSLNFWHGGAPEALPTRLALKEFRSFRGLQSVGTGGTHVANFMAVVLDESMTPRHMRGWGLYLAIARSAQVPQYKKDFFFQALERVIGELDSPRLQIRLTKELAGTIDTKRGNVQSLQTKCMLFLIGIAERHPGDPSLGADLLCAVEKLLPLNPSRPSLVRAYETLGHGKRFSKAGYPEVTLALRTAATLKLMATHDPRCFRWEMIMVSHFQQVAVAMMTNPCTGPGLVKLFEALERLYDLLVESKHKKLAQQSMQALLPWVKASGASLGERWEAVPLGSQEHRRLCMGQMRFAAPDQWPNVLLKLAYTSKPEHLPDAMDFFLRLPNGLSADEIVIEIAQKLRHQGRLSSDDREALAAVAGEALPTPRGHDFLGRKRLRPQEHPSVETVLEQVFAERLSALWRTARRFDANIKAELSLALGESLGHGDAFERAWKRFDGQPLLPARDFIRAFSDAVSEGLNR